MSRKKSRKTPVKRRRKSIKSRKLSPYKRRKVSRKVYSTIAKYSQGRKGLYKRRSPKQRAAAISRSKRSLSKPKYKRRPSPSISATLVPKGTIKKGNDGGLWQNKAVKGGILRWVRF